MAILGIGSGTSAYLDQSVLALKNQLTVLQSQITSGEKSTSYAGMGVNEGFAIAARSQLASITGYSDAMTNINTNIGVANTALQSLVDIGTTVQNSATGSSTALNSQGQSIGQQTAAAQLASMLGILNTQSGNSYLFSGSAINTPSVASYNTIINGTTTQAGLQQVIAQREQADLGTTTIGANGLSGAAIATTGSTVQVTGNGPGSPFAFTLTGASSTGSSATVAGPTGSPAAVSVNLNSQPNTGDQFNFSFTLPDGTPEKIQLTAGTDFTNGATTSATATAISAALATKIGALSVSLGRVAITSSSNSVNVASDSSPFGLKLSAVSATGTAVTTSGPSSTPATGSVTVVSQPASGDQVNFSFKLPDGTTQQITLTATTTNPPPAGSYLIDPGSPNAVPPVAPSTAVTASNLQTALGNAVWNLANTQLVASSAIQAGNDFFSAGTATGSAVSGLSSTNTLSSEGFSAGDTITVNGTAISFVSSGATGNQLNIGGATPATVQTLLNKIDSITGTSTPSTINNVTGTITLHTDDAPDLNITSSNKTALAALGFGSTISGTLAPLRVAGPPYNTATALVSGTPSNTVSWYTGNQGPAGSARGSLSAQVDNSVTVQYGIQADEQAIRSQLQNLAVLSTVTTSPTNPIATQVVSALSQDVAQNLSPQTGQQTIENIQSDLATAQVTMQDAQSRQTQSQTTLQNLIDTTETVSTDQVASEILALQTSLQASYQTTSMLSQLTLTKYLPVG